MKYVGSTIKYLKKSFWLLAIISLPAAVALGFFQMPLSMVTFIPDYIGADVKSFSDIFWMILYKKTITNVWPVIVTFIAIILSVSLMLSVIEKHFRTGRLMVKKPLTDINYTFMPVLKIVFIFFILIMLCIVLLVSLATASHFIFSGRGKPNIISIIVTAIFAIAIFLLFITLVGPMIFMIPMMSIYGYSFGDALPQAYAMAGKEYFKVVSGALFPFLIIIFLQFIINCFSIPYFAQILISVVFYVVLITYVCSNIMIVMFDLSSLERKDLIKLY